MPYPGELYELPLPGPWKLGYPVPSAMMPPEPSQFENHVRAIAGLPLGDPRARGHAVLVNLIGRMPARKAVLGIPGVPLHDYDKSPRPGRKLGHLTAVAATARQRERAALRLLRVAGR